MLDEVRKLAMEVCEREQCVLWDLELKGAGRNRVLRVMIEGADQPASIADCERVSKGLNLLLDVNDVVPGGAYNLEVSSPGIERPLKEAWQFERSLGSQVDIVLNQAVPVAKGDPLRARGELIAVTGTTVKVDEGQGQTRDVELENVKRARTVFLDHKSNKRA